MIKKKTENVSKELGVDFFYGNVLPQDKSKIVHDLQKKGETVGFLGDGINDTPALAIADIGIVIGNGTDIAINTGDVFILKNRLIDVLNSIILSNAVTRKIRQNLFWAFFIT